MPAIIGSSFLLQVTLSFDTDMYVLYDTNHVNKKGAVIFKHELFGTAAALSGISENRSCTNVMMHPSYSESKKYNYYTVAAGRSLS